MTRAALLASTVCAACLASSASAGEAATTDLAALDIEALLALHVDTVGSASKYEQTISSAPASVTVVTRDEIRDLGCRTLAEVLNGVRGLFVTYDRNYTYLGFRGFQRPGDYNTRILLLVDGHAWNDSIWDMAFIGPELGVDLDLVERVEVVRGPSSSVYGGNAFFGIVNVVTRRPASLRPGELSASAGSFGAYGGRASAAFASDHGGEGLLSVSGSDVGGRDLRFAEYAALPGGGWTRGQDWERWGSLLLKYAWRGLAIEVAGVKRDKGIPTGSFGTIYDDPHNQTSDRHLFAEVRYDFAPAPSLDASLRAYYDQYEFVQDYAYAGADPIGPPALSVDHDRGRLLGAEARAVSRLGGGWLLLAGGEARAHLLQELRSYDLAGQVNLLDRRSTGSLSLYAQLEAPLAAWLRAVAGARLDRSAGFAEEVSPRLAVIVTPREGTTVKAMYGRAFRPPNDAEQRYEYVGTFKPNPGIHPERIATSELGVEQRLGKALRLGATAYHYDVDRLISEVVDPADGLGTYANAGSIRATGMEVEASWRVVGGIAARASWAVQRVKDEGSDAGIANSPAGVGKVQLRGPLGWLGLRGGAELLYLSARAIPAGGTEPGHLLVNLSLAAQGLAGGALDLSVGVRNALDTSYGDPTSDTVERVLQDGRSFRAAATWRF